MARTLRVLFRRDPSRDRQDNHIAFEGYQVLWPSGEAVAIGFDAFCNHGQRLMGLGKHLVGCREKLVDMLAFPLSDREDGLNRVPGARVRRFCLRRTGRQGRLHFLDGTPTAIVFNLDSDEDSVLRWIGLADLADGLDQWLDLGALPAELGTPALSLHHAAAPALS